MKKFILAVSGGIDSVVLLDIFSKKSDYKIIVAHFDHGIREDSPRDAVFVEKLAKKYKVPFVVRREELGAACSEEHARYRRYVFLKMLAKTHRAQIVTAHHKNDIAETIAINCARGTGWRGLFVLSDPSLLRPLMGVEKKWIRDYASRNKLTWFEDETNLNTKYLRNRIRAQFLQKDTDNLVDDLYNLRTSQSILQKSITQEIQKIVEKKNVTLIDGLYSRYFFSHIDEASAVEILRYIFLQKTQKTLLPEQRKKVYLAIKTAKNNTTLEAGEHIRVVFSKTGFNIEG